MTVLMDSEELAALDWEMDSTDEELEIDLSLDDAPEEGELLEWDGATWVVVSE